MIHDDSFNVPSGQWIPRGQGKSTGEISPPKTLSTGWEARGRRGWNFPSVYVNGSVRELALYSRICGVLDRTTPSKSLSLSYRMVETKTKKDTVDIPLGAENRLEISPEIFLDRLVKRLGFSS
jgi:hypothetical protein